MDKIGTDLQLLDWQKLDSWVTPREKFFRVAHYRMPRVDAKDFRGEVTGLVENRRTYTLDEIKALPKKEVIFTKGDGGPGNTFKRLSLSSRSDVWHARRFRQG